MPTNCVYYSTWVAILTKEKNGCVLAKVYTINTRQIQTNRVYVRATKWVLKKAGSVISLSNLIAKNGGRAR